MAIIHIRFASSRNNNRVVVVRLVQNDRACIVLLLFVSVRTYRHISGAQCAHTRHTTGESRTSRTDREFCVRFLLI